MDFDEHVAFLDDRPIDVFDPQDIWRAIAVDNHCFHWCFLLLAPFGFPGLIGAPCFHLRPAR